MNGTGAGSAGGVIVRLLRLAQVVGRRHPAHGRTQWVYTQ
jgi:hypothetical protein